jgi:hypothetical protein
MSYKPSAILAVSSLDRYTAAIPGTLSRTYRPLFELITNFGQPGNSFELVSNSAFIYGYMTHLIISQIQLDYRVPTIVPSNNIFRFANNPDEPTRIGNDVMPMIVGNIAGGFDLIEINIPYGFYTPEEMAAMLQIQIRAVSPRLSEMTVIYSNSGGGRSTTDPQFPVQPGDTGFGNSFIFSTVDTSGTPVTFNFPEIFVLSVGFRYNDDQITAVLKLYRLLGITGSMIFQRLTNYLQTSSPNFLYTPYIDIISNTLTKFQKVKDTDTSIYRRTGLLARIYLSSVGGPQETSATSSLGCQPFITTADLNSPKVIRWSKDEAIYNLDFQLYDQYGDLLYWTQNNATEFQMTLMCLEDDY